MTNRTQYPTLITDIATQFSLDANLLEAQVIQESSGDPNAFRWEPAFFRHYISGNPEAKAHQYGPLAACSFGLLQIMLETAVEYGFTGRPEDLCDPRTGLAAGAQVVRALWDHAGGTPLTFRTALAAYNGGPALLHVDPAKWPPGPAAYVARIYKLAQQ